MHVTFEKIHEHKWVSRVVFGRLGNRFWIRKTLGNGPFINDVTQLGVVFDVTLPMKA